jgi:hypothetical protein
MFLLYFGEWRGADKSTKACKMVARGLSFRHVVRCYTGHGMRRSWCWVEVAKDLSLWPSLFSLNRRPGTNMTTTVKGSLGPYSLRHGAQSRSCHDVEMAKLVLVIVTENQVWFLLNGWGCGGQGIAQDCEDGAQSRSYDVTCSCSVELQDDKGMLRTL